jgi:hypothetical protein
MNPRVLHDHAELMRELGDLEEAEDALRAAIALAPNFAAAFAALASLQAHAKKWAAAARLQARVVELRPGDAHAGVLLAEYLGNVAPAPVAEVEPEHVGPPEVWDLPARTAALDVRVLAESLAQRGYAAAPLLTPAECQELRELCAGDGPGLDRILASDADGRCRWRHFLVPPPLPVAALRAALFGPAAALANLERQRLRDAADFPTTHASWPRARLGSSTSRWVELTEGGFAAMARAGDRRSFPLRAVLDLGPGDAPADTVLVQDQLPGRKKKQSAGRSRSGDVVFVEQRERIAQVGGVFGLQPVRYGLGPVRAARQLLDLDFDGR